MESDQTDSLIDPLNPREPLRYRWTSSGPSAHGTIAATSALEHSEKLKELDREFDIREAALARRNAEAMKLLKSEYEEQMRPMQKEFNAKTVQKGNELAGTQRVLQEQEQCFKKLLSALDYEKEQWSTMQLELKQEIERLSTEVAAYACAEQTLIEHEKALARNHFSAVCQHLYLISQAHHTGSIKANAQMGNVSSFCCRCFQPILCELYYGRPAKALIYMS